MPHSFCEKPIPILLQLCTHKSSEQFSFYFNNVLNDWSLCCCIATPIEDRTFTNHYTYWWSRST